MSCRLLASGGVELLLAGGVLLLGDALLLGGCVELLGLFTSLEGGVVVLGDVLLLGGVEVLGGVELLGLLTSLCGMVLPLALQSDEIIFTLLTLMLLELEDDGLVLPAALPLALPLGEVEPVTWIR